MFLNFSILPTLKNPLAITIDLLSHGGAKFGLIFRACTEGLERPEWILKKNKSLLRVQDLQQPFQRLVPISPADGYGAGA